MSNYREIVTKAIIGKARKTSSEKHILIPENKPDTILGCWVINHTFNGTNNNGNVVINGSYDVNVWYSLDDNHKTAVNSSKYNYVDNMSVTLKEHNDGAEDIIVRSLKQPTVSDVKINNGNIELTIEKELGVEVVGDSVVRVSALDTEEDYEEIIDDQSIDKEIENNVDSKYL